MKIQSTGISVAWISLTIASGAAQISPIPPLGVVARAATWVSMLLIFSLNIRALEGMSIVHPLGISQIDWYKQGVGWPHNSFGRRVSSEFRQSVCPFPKISTDPLSITLVV